VTLSDSAPLQRKKPLTRKTPMRSTKALHATPGRVADRRADPKAEAMRKLWTLLDERDVAGLRFRRRELVGPYLVDFLCPAARLVICLNGEEDDNAEQAAWLRSQGYRVLAFAAAEVARDPQRVLDAVADVFTLRVIPGKS